MSEVTPDSQDILVPAELRLEQEVIDEFVEHNDRLFGDGERNQWMLETDTDEWFVRPTISYGYDRDWPHMLFVWSQPDRYVNPLPGGEQLVVPGVVMAELSVSVGAKHEVSNFGHLRDRLPFDEFETWISFEAEEDPDIFCIPDRADIPLKLTSELNVDPKLLDDRSRAAERANSYLKAINELLRGELTLAGQVVD